ncbi:DUF3280 domain-containing protein [Teichococcus wenyumeiae]|nr:DUF3280 domain-containing protein [Pseudoroseomonas wenyumeiae]
MWRRTTMLLLAGLAAAQPAWAADPPSLAVFDLELYDTSGEPAQPEQDARLQKVTAELRDRISASGRYKVVSLPAPASAELQRCDDCAITKATQSGADLALVGLVHKVSTLILKMTLILREVPSGAVRGTWTADFRGNTDESWQRAARWLLRNRVLATPSQDAAPG